MTQAYVDAAVRGALAQLEQAGPGTINDTLFVVACRLFTFVNAGVLDETEAHHLLSTAAAARGHDARSIHDTLKSARRRTAGQAATLPSPHDTMRRTAARPSPATAYGTLDAYAHARGVTSQVYRDAGWEECRHHNRPALRFTTPAGPRWRYLDGDSPRYWHAAGSHTDTTKCWYRLADALTLAAATPQALVLCNGESSVVAAQAHGVAAVCLTGGGERTLPARLCDELLDAWPGAFVVALDCDEKGRTAAPALAAQLRAAGRVVRAVDLGLGHKNDLADFCALHNGSSVADLAVCSELPVSAPVSAAPTARPTWLLDEAAIDALGDPVWLIRRVIVSGEVTVVYGPSDAGKTFILVDIALRVAQHYPVLYVAAEDARGVKRRKQAWQQHHQCTNTGRFFLRDRGCDLLDAAAVEELIAGARTIAPQLIVIDTLSQCVPGADENSARDMSSAMASAQRIAHTTNAAVIIIHHTTKEGSTYRGSGTIKGNTYGMLEVDIDDGVIELRSERIKNNPTTKARFFKLVVVPLGSDAEGEPITSCVIAPARKVGRGDTLSTNEVKILETLAVMTDSTGGARTGELHEATRLAKGKSFYKPLGELKKLGLITKPGKHTDPFMITDAGRARLARESADPDYQSIDTSPEGDINFEVNLTLRSNDTGVGGGECAGSDRGSSAGSTEGSTGGSMFLPSVSASHTATPDATAATASARVTTPCNPVSTLVAGSDTFLPSLPPAVAGEEGSNGATQRHPQAHMQHADQPTSLLHDDEPPALPPPPSPLAAQVAEQVFALVQQQCWSDAQAQAEAVPGAFGQALCRLVAYAAQSEHAEGE